MVQIGEFVKTNNGHDFRESTDEKFLKMVS